MPFRTAWELHFAPLVRSIGRRATGMGLSDQDVGTEVLLQDTFHQALRVWDAGRIPAPGSAPWPGVASPGAPQAMVRGALLCAPEGASCLRR
ncbi:hypothetical protein ACFZDK_52090 [Streptomyces sp. NPDC007901]|uniref:hypothetical protein n=1 Tax=Streptomyces sp. NPDC007901 TaxID=3364785 RepID=UPI0036F0512A